MAMKNLHEPKLKKTYCYLKALKSLMGVEISSYQLKKVLLLEEFSQLAGTAADATHLVYLALTHHHLHSTLHGHEFEDDKGRRVEIDFDKWKRRVDNGLERESYKEKEAADGQATERSKEPICTDIPVKRK